MHGQGEFSFDGGEAHGGRVPRTAWPPEQRALSPLQLLDRVLTVPVEGCVKLICTEHGER